MNERICFRAKTTKKNGNEAFNNVWVEGDLIKNKNKYYIHPRANVFKVENELAKLMVCHEVIPETIGQYTGLTDKNGTKIFEGDIVKWDEKTWGCPYNELVTFDYELLAVRKNDYKHYVEVIGDICDTPELLEVEE